MDYSCLAKILATVTRTLLQSRLLNKNDCQLRLPCLVIEVPNDTRAFFKWRAEPPHAMIYTRVHVIVY